MIIDHRTYTVHHGRSGEYLRLFETIGLPLQMKHLGNLIGYFQTTVGPLNQLVHLWGFEDLGDMERRRAARDADPEWAAFLTQTAGFLAKQENKILRPVSFSPLK